MKNQKLNLAVVFIIMTFGASCSKQQFDQRPSSTMGNILTTPSAPQQVDSGSGAGASTSASASSGLNAIQDTTPAPLPACSTVAVGAPCVNDLLSCNGHPDSTTWFDVSNDINSVNKTCGDGSVVVDKFKISYEFICNNGVSTKTGKQQNGATVSLAQCPDIALNCGTHLAGSLWFEPNATLTSVPRTCATPSLSTNIFDYFKTETQYRCDNGSILSTGTTRQVGLVKSDPCPGEKACGTHTEGSTWFENVGSIQAPRECIASSVVSVNDIYWLKKQYLCLNGIAVDQNNDQKGDIISYGVCLDNNNSCLGHNEGETWSEVVKNSTISESVICADNSQTSNVTFEKIQVKQCVNQVAINLQTEKGKQLTFATCSLKNCGNYRSGESFLKVSDNIISSDKQCGDKVLKVSFQAMNEMVCKNGSIENTGNVIKGQQIGSDAACNNNTSADNNSVSSGNSIEVISDEIDEESAENLVQKSIAEQKAYNVQESASASASASVVDVAPVAPVTAPVTAPVAPVAPANTNKDAKKSAPVTKSKNVKVKSEVKNND